MDRSSEKISLAIFISFVLVFPAISSRFRGSHITWRPVNPEERFDGRIEFTIHVAWKRSNGDSGKYFCNATTISDHVSVPGRGNLKCQSGCYGKLGDMQVYCSMFNEAEDWMIGHRSYIATMRNTVTKFEASFTGASWQPVTVGGGKWEVRVKGDLSIRRDTRKINTSPISLIRPIIRLKFNQPRKLLIPVEDADGDVVHCRWANSSLNECGGVCNGFPFGTLNEENCILNYNGSGASNGLYAAAVQVEDFPMSRSRAQNRAPEPPPRSGDRTRTPPNGDNNPPALSSVPLQFVIHTFSGSDIPPPTFENSTLKDREMINVQRDSLFLSRIVANPSNRDASITIIQTLMPPGMIKSALGYIPGLRQWYIDVKWTPSSVEIGPQCFCFQAYDSQRYYSQPSELRCVTLKPIGVDPPKLRLMWMCHHNILIQWDVPANVEKNVTRFKVTVYNVTGDVVIKENFFKPEMRLYNFLDRTPGEEYRFKLEMGITRKKTDYEAPVYLDVRGRCPEGKECCLFNHDE